MLLLDGKGIAATIRAELAGEIRDLTGKIGRSPGLAVILAGDDKPSQTYVRNKERACAEIGIESETLRLPADIGPETLLGLIDSLNVRPDIDGILVQLPLPGGVDSRACLERIDPSKDVDGFHPVNMGRLMLGLPGLRPCTPAGVMEMLKRCALTPAGKRAVVLGRSNIVGKPLAVMLGAKGASADATVTVCHSATPDAAEYCRNADFVFLAMGKPESVRGDMIKKGAVVVDIGISVTEKGLRGDADFASVSAVAAAASPVPGGVGPMTIAMLMGNTVQAYKAHAGITQRFT
ncbi:MAG: bifunctional methylenetetrahydrofolate dehydrogenase/methenyltetrahydrofolate cyclohydrolase FolD [Desulfovibrio sp.]|jgi:methylenetetrahydrofolate dehydrogenase (NADP+)/methenyltetrahydrofolate cyclohydrolase|nr:bifunctional methylenetetrahydrofolate dehydrogenase/methenyltetrahydrofolate cyclohydrolase FolD [Desulfovibrio sp.]